jgi:hypothetical protein
MGGGGLLLVVLTWQVRVLAPALFAPKGLWGLRHLTCEEILVAKDFSLGAVEKLALETLSNALLADLVPGKCLVFGFRALINGGGVWKIVVQRAHNMCARPGSRVLKSFRT